MLTLTSCVHRHGYRDIMYLCTQGHTVFRHDSHPGPARTGALTDGQKAGGKEGYVGREILREGTGLRRTTSFSVNDGLHTRRLSIRL
jgi:hypothetical protein